jgi:hypothetical protein
MIDVNTPPAGEVPRIAIGWSTAIVAEFRQLANGPLPGRHPIESALAPALLLAAEGDFGRAEAHVLKLMEEHAESDSLRGPLFFPFFLALFVVQRFDLASRVLQEHWKLDCAIELCIGAPSPGFACVRWEIISSSHVRFVFDESVLGRDNTNQRLLSFHWLFPLFADYLKRGAEATGAVDVSLWDTGLAPGLAFCSNRPDHFLIPDNLFISSRAYEAANRAYQENDVPWKQRRDVAFWRGTTTGHPLDRTIGWRALPRIKLCELAAQHGDLFDVGISGVSQMNDPAVKSAIHESGVMRPFVPAAEFNRYRYQIDIDGNTNSWPGLYQRLLTGSPVLKIASPSGHRQWYYHRLRPWINFIPVAADMSDLVDKLSWLREHDDEARAIGEQGQALALSMDFEGELKRAARIITAALHYFAGEPETEVRFGLNESGNACLQDGWLQPLKDGVGARGFESRLKLPRPVAVDDFVLSLDLSPSTEPPALIPQRVLVVANGDVLLDATLTERQTLRCALSRRTIEKDEALLVTLLHPDAQVGASAAHPLNGLMVSVVLHGLSLTAAHVHAAQRLRVAPSGPEGDQSASPAENMPANPVLAGVQPKQILTSHGTVVFADLTTSRLRHGPLALSPANIFLAVDGQTAYLLSRRPDGTQRPISVHPAVVPWQASNFAQDGEASTGEFCVVNARGSAFGLARNGLFLCAEDDGQVTLSRQRLGPWELFHASEALATVHAPRIGADGSAADAGLRTGA